MGYYTDYKLSVSAVNEDQEEALEKIFSDGLGMEEWGEEWFASGKWYDHEEDMKRISLEFPNVLFELYGDGEESDDMWYKYFRNGKMQYCPARIEFDPYDESKLE